MAGRLFLRRGRRRAAGRTWALFGLAAAAALFLAVLAAELGMRGRRRASPEPEAQGRADGGGLGAEGRAELLFLRARDAMASQRWAEAKESVALLEAECSATDFYEGHRAEIGRLAKIVGDLLEKQAERREPERAGETKSKGPSDGAARRVSCDFAATPLKDAVARLARQARCNVVLDHEAVEAKAPTVTLEAQDVELAAAIDRIGRPFGLLAVWRDGAFFVTTPERARRAQRGDAQWEAHQKPPDEQAGAAVSKPVSFDFVDAPLPSVVSSLSTQVRIPAVLDVESLRKRVGRVTLRVDGMPFESALRWVCRRAGLVVVWRGGALFIATPERARDVLRKDEAGPALRRGG